MKKILRYSLLLLFVVSCESEQDYVSIPDLLEYDLKSDVCIVTEDYYPKTYMYDNGLLVDTAKVSTRTILSFNEYGNLNKKIFLIYKLDLERLGKDGGYKTISDLIRLTKPDLYIKRESIFDDYGRYLNYSSINLKNPQRTTYTNNEFIDTKKGTIILQMHQIDNVQPPINDNDYYDRSEQEFIQYNKKTKRLVILDTDYPTYYDINKLRKLFDFNDVSIFDSDGILSSTIYYDYIGRRDCVIDKYFNGKSWERRETNYYYTSEGYQDFNEEIIRYNYKEEDSNDTIIYKYRNNKQLNDQDYRYYYNDQGLLIKRENRYSDYTLFYEYEYDNKGNWIIQKAYHKTAPQPDEIIIRHIQYYDGSNSDDVLKRYIRKYYNQQYKPEPNTTASVRVEEKKDNGRTPCPVCHGFPHLKCLVCGGTGQISRLQNVGGSLYTVFDPCPYCNAGYTLCAGCNGTGFIGGSTTVSAPINAPIQTPSSETPEIEPQVRFQPEYGYVERDCPSCFGDGVCSTCNGKGYYSGSYGTGSILCPNCDHDHNGKCKMCHGTGKVTRYERLSDI